MKTKKVYHNFYSEDGTREGIVFRYVNDPAWYVALYENSDLIETRKMETDGVLHSERYAEDCGENWVLKVF